jgi:competence protein CoiA
MAFFALDEEESVSSWDADPRKIYRCIECAAPVKVRRGKTRIPHFYHLRNAPSCRLYSKSEDHLLLQLQIQKLLPKGKALMEQPIPSINRVSDLLWEEKKIAFEIQCSTLLEAEAEARMREYKSAGYDVVWILDDRVFNKRLLRPAEEFLRRRLCFFASFNRMALSLFYDQFEIFQRHQRVKKGTRITIDLQNVYTPSQPKWPPQLPLQIERRIENCSRFFARDLLHRALLSNKFPTFVVSLQNWRMLEARFQEEKKEKNRIKEFLRRWIFEPYLALLDEVLKRTP